MYSKLEFAPTKSAICWLVVLEPVIQIPARGLVLTTALDKFLDDALELDVDALFDGKDLYLAGIMEHIEEAGIHSGDSACVS